MDTMNLIQYVREYLMIPAFIIDNETVESFEENHCFSKSVQPYYTVENITVCANAMKSNFFYEIPDTLGTRILLFKLQDQNILVGPYVEEKWDDLKAEKLFAKLKIPASSLISYKMYYCAYKEQSTQGIINMLTALLHNFYSVTSEFTYRNLQGIRDNQFSIYQEVESFDQSLVEKRYQAENYFIESFKTGDTKIIMEAYRKMQPMHVGISFWTSVKNVYDGNIVIRTLSRKAVEAAGVNVLVVDAISQEFAQKGAQITSASQSKKFCEKMFARYAEAVRESMDSKYSRPIRKTIDYIGINLSNELSMEELSEVAGISKNHLSKLFRSETKLTTSEYISKTRCKKAADLLIKTDLTIGEIADFVGYIDNNYFVKVFKKWSGKSPSEYRKSN